MVVTQLPFNAHIGIEESDRPDRLLVLRPSDDLLNHLGTLHASALFAVAEASSGHFLVVNRRAREDIGGVLRHAECKYSRPATGEVVSTSTSPPSSVDDAIKKVDAKGRALITVAIDLRQTTDSGEETVAKFTFNWLLGRAGASPQSP